MVDTRYQDVLMAKRPTVTLPGVVIDVVSGTIAGVTGPAVNHWPVQGAMIALDPGATADYPLPADHRAFVYVLSGELNIAGRAVRAGQVAWSDPLGDVASGSLLQMAVPDRDARAKVMVYSGRPIRERVAFGGPFVMNDPREIAEAFRDFHAGRFGEVPRLARLQYDR
jgi:redox-sensitive bicupin YhaK (pirin superfamily)